MSPIPDPLHSAPRAPCSGTFMYFGQKFGLWDPCCGWGTHQPDPHSHPASIGTSVGSLPLLWEMVPGPLQGMGNPSLAPVPGVGWHKEARGAALTGLWLAVPPALAPTRARLSLCPQGLSLYGAVTTHKSKACGFSSCCSVNWTAFLIAFPLCVEVSGASSRPGGGVYPWTPCAALEDLAP